MSSVRTIEVQGYLVEQAAFYLVSPKPFITLDNGAKCELRDLYEFSTAGEKFATSSSCVKFGIDRRFGKFYYGGMGTFTFIDDDGDGKFETRFSSASEILIVPQRLRKQINRVPTEPLPPPIRRN